MVATWRIEWDNPEGEKNTTNATVTPQTSGLRSTDQTGQGDENVPVGFTLSGGSATDDDSSDDDRTADDDTPDDEKTDDDNTDDDKTDPPQPARTTSSLRSSRSSRRCGSGDEGQDQWVEYAQRLLQLHLDPDIVVDGDFGKATEAAVVEFQKRKGLAVDGIIGNQTWAALREGSPESPSTDGRDPHSYVEAGAEARWALESENNNAWLESDDLYWLLVVAVGDTPLDPATEATIRVAPPGTSPSVVKLPIGTVTEENNRLVHYLQIENFRATYPSVPPEAPITAYRVEAYLPQELGGDYFGASVKPMP